MSRADYEAFKERMRKWMSDHADAYDAFEEMMNYESDESYRLVMTTAMKLLPKFAKAAAKQMNTRGAIDVDTVIAQCSGSSWKIQCKMPLKPGDSIPLCQNNPIPLIPT